MKIFPLCSTFISREVLISCFSLLVSDSYDESKASDTEMMTIHDGKSSVFIQNRITDVHTNSCTLINFAIYQNSMFSKCLSFGGICKKMICSHPPKGRRVTYARGIRPASVSASGSTLSTSMKPLHGIISYCTCILV